MTIGDRVGLNAEGRKWLGWNGVDRDRIGTVVGLSRPTTPGPRCAWVLWDGLKSRQAYALEFLEMLDERKENPCSLEEQTEAKEIARG